MDEKLAAAVRAHLASAGAIREVKMFGGIGSMLNGNLVAAASKRGLLLRLGKGGGIEADWFSSDANAWPYDGRLCLRRSRYA